MENRDAGEPAPHGLYWNDSVTELARAVRPSRLPRICPSCVVTTQHSVYERLKSFRKLEDTAVPKTIRMIRPPTHPASAWHSQPFPFFARTRHSIIQCNLFSGRAAMAVGLIHSRQCGGVLPFKNSEMMSASAVSNLPVSSSNLGIMLRLLVPLKSTGVTLDTERLQ